MRLKVKENVGPHFKGGVKYSPGDEFDGTQAELNAFGDKLELVESPAIDDSQLKVSVPSGKNKRGRPKKRIDNESDGRTDSDMD